MWLAVARLGGDLHSTPIGVAAIIAAVVVVAVPVGFRVARQFRPLLRGRCDVELDLTRPVQQMAHQGDRSRVLGDIEQDRVRQTRQGRGGGELGLKLSPQFGPKFGLTPR